jgi:hypothetical protein
MIEQYIKELEGVATWQDREAAHERADHILCAALIYLGHSRLTQAYHDVLKRYYA